MTRPYRLPDVYGADNVNVVTDIILASNNVVRTRQGPFCLTSEAVQCAEGFWHHRDHVQTCEHCGAIHDTSFHYSWQPNQGDHWLCSEDCAEEFGLYWHDRDGLWYDYPEPIIDLLEYCAQNPHIEGATRSRPFRIGIEVEKEDSNYISEANARAQDRDWIAVHDGSLDRNTGFELVSPCYNLANLDMIEEIIADYDDLDADSSDTCGGHMTVSEFGLTGEQFAEKHVQMGALLMALYDKRLANRYALGTKSHDGKRPFDGNKYRAINVKRDCVEYRMIARVRTRKQLIWRLRLINHCVNNPDTLFEEMKDKSSWLYRHLLDHYTADEVAEKALLFRDFYYWETGSPASNRIAKCIPHQCV